MTSTADGSADGPSKGSISLRDAWYAAPFSPLKTVRGLSLGGRLYQPPLTPESALPEVPDPGPLLRPLSEGLRASSQIVPLSGSPPLPFASLRRLIRSFGWPTDWKFTSFPSDLASPTASKIEEVQGITYTEDYLYLVQTNAIWALARRTTAAVIEYEDTVISGEHGLQHSGSFVGRKHIPTSVASSDDPGPTKHLSDPTMYQGLLLVPAEGVPYPAGDTRGVPLGTFDEKNDPEKKNDLGKQEYQWVWAFDPRNLGLVCRIAIPAWVPSRELGLGDSERAAGYFSACSADADTGYLYVTRSGDERSVQEVYIFKLPDLSIYDSSRSVKPLGTYGLAYEDQFSVPTEFATYVGYLPLRDTDINATLLGLGTVNGCAVSPAGHLYVDFEQAYGGSDGKDVYGVLGFDMLLGRAVRYIGLGGIAGTEYVQGLDVIDNSLRVLIWDVDIWSDDEFSVYGYTPPEGEDV